MRKKYFTAFHITLCTKNIPAQIQSQEDSGAHARRCGGRKGGELEVMRVTTALGKVASKRLRAELERWKDCSEIFSLRRGKIYAQREHSSFAPNYFLRIKSV
jgi:hypothetical protein